MNALRPAALRKRLLTILLVPLLGLLVLSVFVDFHTAEKPAHAAYDHALSDDVVELSAQVALNDGKWQLEISEASQAVLRNDHIDTEFFAVLAPDATLIAGDPGLLPDAAEDGNPHLVDTEFLGHKVRKATYRLATPQGTITTVIAETMHKRDRTASQIFTAMLVPNFLIIAATLLLVYFGIRFGLAPLTQLSEEIGRRSHRDLRPLDEAPVPDEAAPLVRAINALIADLKDAGEAQQKFLADAAHQLRTPIAGLQTQIELAAGDLPDPHRQRMSLVLQATYRLGHLTHQLLALARSGPEANASLERQEINLACLLEESASRSFDDAIAHGIDLGYEADPAKVHGTRWLLAEMLANLIDNAIRYTPAGGHVTVRCGQTADGAFLEVEDDGPGIAADERERVFDRFYRARSSNGTGSGLGLAIVREVADRHGARLLLTSGADDRGCRFRIEFPAAAALAAT